MRNTLAAGMAVLTLAGAGLAAAPASARDWDGYGRGHNDDVGYAIAGGIVGLALGAALASNHHDYYPYRDGYYGYYGNGGYYGGYGGYYGPSRYYRYNNGYGYVRPHYGYGYSQPYYGSRYGYGNGYGYGPYGR